MIETPAPDGDGPKTASGTSTGSATRAEIVIAGLSALVGSILRFVPDSPLWLDEALTVNIASGELGSVTELLRSDGHPPLYYWLQGWWIDLFGSGDAAVRSLSGVIGVATIGLTWMVARRLLGPRVAAASVVVVSMSPFAIRYGSEARMYALVFALALLLVLAAETAYERSSTRSLVAVSVTSGLLLLTHYWSFFLLGAAGLLALIAAVRSPHADERRRAGRLAAALASGLLLFAPWIGGFLDQLGSTGTPWAPRPRPTVVVSETLLGLSGGLSPESILLGLALGSFWMVGVFTRRIDRLLVVDLTDDARLRRFAAVTVLTIGAGAIVSYLGDSGFAARYAAVFLPMVLLTIAAGVARLPRAEVRVGLLVVVALLGAGAIANDIRNDRTQAGQIAATILEHAEPGDAVVYCPDQLGPATARILGDAQLVQFTYDQLGDPRLVDWVDYEARHAASDPAAFAAAVDERAATSGRIFVVWSDAYRSVESRCSAVVDAFASLRPGARQLVAGDANRYFENASLHEIEPRTP